MIEASVAKFQVGTEEFVTHLESSSRSIEPGARSFVEIATL
jgi:hypothetical protein